MRRVRKRRKRSQITDQLGSEDGLVAVGQVFVHAHHHAVRDDRQDDHVPGHQGLAASHGYQNGLFHPRNYYLL